MVKQLGAILKPANPLANPKGRNRNQVLVWLVHVGYLCLPPTVAGCKQAGFIFVVKIPHCPHKTLNLVGVPRMLAEWTRGDAGVHEAMMDWTP